VQQEVAKLVNPSNEPEEVEVIGLEAFIVPQLCEKVVKPDPDSPPVDDTERPTPAQPSSLATCPHRF
jgi:hypothetical protein